MKLPLKHLRTATAALLAADLALLLLAWQGPAWGVASPSQGVAFAASAALSVLLVGLAWALARRLQASQMQVDEDRRLIQDAFDAVPAAVVLFDAQDRLLLCNADFRQLYLPLQDLLQPGTGFETLLRAGVARGLVPEAQGREAAWVSARLARRGQPQPPMLRQMADGRWRRIVETRLPNGRLLAHSIDITEIQQQQQALDAVRQAAELSATRLQDAIEALPAGFELYDAQDRLVMTNSVLRTLYPLIDDLARRQPPPSFEEVVRTHHARGGLPHLPDQAALDAWLRQRHAERRAPAGTLLATHVVRQSDGRWIRSHERRTRDGGVVGVRLDVTEAETQRERANIARLAAEQAQQRLTDAIDALPDAFVLFDADDRVVAFNARYVELYAASASVIRLGARFEDLLRFGLAHGQFPQALGREADWLAERLSAHRHPRGPLVQELPGNRWVRIDERRTRDGGLAGVRADITELVRREQELAQLNTRLGSMNDELSQLSETDALTGLANRRQFDRRLASELGRAVRHGMPLALLLLDVDHFKAYNDRHGHLAGDACLRQVAAVLRSCAQRPTDLVARWGGEEFAMLLPYADAQQAHQQALRCLAALDEAALPHGASPLAAHVTLSAGVAAFSTQGAGDAEALVRAADTALYRAKMAGRHGVVAG